MSAASPTITPRASPATVTLNGGSPPTLNDSATLSGGYHESGHVTFTLYAPSGTTVDTETVTISGNGTYGTLTGYTLPATGTVTGTYQWVASYSGDGNNNLVTSLRGTEPVSVGTASPTISTAPNPNSVTLSGSSVPKLNDSATLAAGYHETGNITFTLYQGGTTVVDTETVAVSGNGTYTTPTGYTLPTSGSVTGTYQWVASYSGDSNNNAVASQRRAEPVQVTSAAPSINTIPNPTGVTLGGTGSPTLKDSATLGGGYHETGTITSRSTHQAALRSTPRW